MGCSIIEPFDSNSVRTIYKQILWRCSKSHINWTFKIKFCFKINFFNFMFFLSNCVNRIANYLLIIPKSELLYTQKFIQNLKKITVCELFKHKLRSILFIIQFYSRILNITLSSFTLTLLMNFNVLHNVWESIITRSNHHFK